MKIELKTNKPIPKSIKSGDTFIAVPIGQKPTLTGKIEIVGTRFYICHNHDTWIGESTRNKHGYKYSFVFEVSRSIHFSGVFTSFIINPEDINESYQIY